MPDCSLAPNFWSIQTAAPNPATTLWCQPAAFWKKLSYVGVLIFGPLLGTFFVEMFLEVTSELHGAPLVPKRRPGCKQNVTWDFIDLTFGSIFEIFSGGNLENAISDLPFFVEAVFRVVCLILGVFLGDSLGLWVSLGSSNFAILLYVKSQIPRVCWLSVL